MKAVLILVFSNLKNDARVKRQINFLKNHYKLTVVCFDADEIPGVKLILLNQTVLTPLRKACMGVALFFRLYNLAYKLFHDYHSALVDFHNEAFDLIIANDIDTLPLAFTLRGNRKSKIIFDAHEYAPRHFENNRTWKIFFQPFYLHLCKKYIPAVDGMTTVGKGLAREYKNNFDVDPIVITNATRYYEVTPQPVSNTAIRLIHHGIANQSRRLELMIDMMSLLDDRFSLDMILMTSDFASGQTKAYIKKLISSASKHPRIKILPQVKSEQIVSSINTYDIGVFLIPPINFNYANTLPNKLFEFIQARLGVAVGPTPEMAEIVTHYDLGVVSEDFTAESLAKALMNITPEKLKHFKYQSSLAAKDLNAEKNEVIFKTLIEKILN